MNIMRHAHIKRYTPGFDTYESDFGRKRPALGAIFK